MTEAARNSQAGRLAIVTGTGGLGLEAAKALAILGADVIIAGRNPVKGNAAVSEVQKAAPQADVRFESLDLADLSSVSSMADRLLATGRAIDLLLNNAGIMSPPVRRVTADGFEAQLGTNHLGHFALTVRLLPLLRKSTAARVVNVTSLAHRYTKIDFDDLQSERRYKAGIAYCQSKLAVAMFSRSLQHHADAGGWPIQSMAAHPGFAGTNLFAAEQGASAFMTILSKNIIVPLIGQSATDGARPLIHAATSPDAQGGKLYGPTGFMEMRGKVGECAFAKAALDDTAAERLWQVSEDLCGLKA